MATAAKESKNAFCYLRIRLNFVYVVLGKHKAMGRLFFFLSQYMLTLLRVLFAKKESLNKGENWLNLRRDSSPISSRDSVIWNKVFIDD